MPSGQRKKGSNKKDVQAKKRQEKQPIASDSNTLESCSEECSLNKQEEFSRSSGKYGKRQIYDNADRYNEPNQDVFEEKSIARSFDVVASSIEGDSYFQLKEEKDWGLSNENGDIGNTPVMDCDELVSALKCIPLHIALNVPEEYFTPAMICKFEKQATKHRALNMKTKEKKDISPSLPEADNLIIKENLQVESENDDMHESAIVLSEKTENLIESLTSCLTLKDVPSTTTKDYDLLSNTDNSEHDIIAEDNSDDLSFLLSLSDPTTSTLPIVQPDDASIDSWLEQLLKSK